MITIDNSIRTDINRLRPENITLSCILPNLDDHILGIRSNNYIVYVPIMFFMCNVMYVCNNYVDECYEFILARTYLAALLILYYLYFFLQF